MVLLKKYQNTPRLQKIVIPQIDNQLNGVEKNIYNHQNISKVLIKIVNNFNFLLVLLGIRLIIKNGLSPLASLISTSLERKKVNKQRKSSHYD